MTEIRVLHVDDDEPTLRAVARLLQGAGFAVVSTTSPFIAPLIKNEKPDVILMDVDMPLLTGDRIMSIIRGNEFSTLPVIFFSSKPREQLTSIAARCLPADYVQKSDGISALAKKITEVVLPRLLT